MIPYRSVVADPLIDRSLAQLAYVKLELNITGTDQDVLLTTAIRQQSAVAVSYCGRELIQEPITDYFRLGRMRRPDEGLEPLNLSRWPIKSITSVIEGDTVLTTDQYEIDEQKGRLWRLDGNNRRLCWGRDDRITVAFVGGYEVFGEPGDLERAITLMVKQHWFSKGRDSTIKSEEVPGVYNVQYGFGNVGDDGLTPDVAGILDNYRASAI